MFGGGWGLALIILPEVMVIHLLLTFAGLKAKENNIFKMLWIIFWIATIIVVMLELRYPSFHLVLLAFLTIGFPQIVFTIRRTKMNRFLDAYILVSLLMFAGFFVYYLLGVFSTAYPW